MDFIQSFPFKCCLSLGIFSLIFLYYSLYFEPPKFMFNWPEMAPKCADKNKNLEKIIRKNDWSKVCAAKITGEEYDRLFPPTVDRYVFASWGNLCGGIGNQMWRFASLYGLSKPYGRTPIFKNDQKCLKSHGPHETEGNYISSDEELQKVFPNYAYRLKYINEAEKKKQTFFLQNFAQGCCSYEDPQKIFFSRIQQKYVKIDGYYFQSYKFFEGRRTEIRQIFQFGPSICSAVEIYKRELFQNDTSHKLCVHVRIEDFKQFGFDSKKDFTEKGIEFVHKILRKNNDQISLVLMGAEKGFLANLRIDKKLFPHVFLPRPMSRGLDMAFGASICDSLLITAPASTFSWWIAYLMPDLAPIFYDANLEGTPYSRENFLPEWTPIRLTENGTINLD